MSPDLDQEPAGQAATDTPQPFRWRGVVGGVAIVLGLPVYAVLAASASLWVPRHWAAELAFYLTAGLLWLWPASRLVAWAARERR